MESIPLAVTFESDNVWSVRVRLFRWSTYCCLSFVPELSIYTKFDAIWDSTASQSFCRTASQSSFVYCSAPVADFQLGFFGSFQMDCAVSRPVRLKTILNE